MSLRSMTGYGRGEAAARGIRVEVELSSVNRKQLEIRVNLPRSLVALESRLVETIQGATSRGQITGSVTVQVSESLKRKSLRVDRELAASYIKELRKTAEALELTDDLSASLLTTLPEVVTYSAADQDIEGVWPVLEKALKEALKQLVAMRHKEGVALTSDLRRRLAILAKLGAEVMAEAPRVAERYREVFRTRLAAAGLPLDVNDPAILKEVTLFADRSDITEELTRLGSHLKQADGLLKSAEPVGRTLDFMAQEMFREINTIGSKANEVRITRHVIEFKTELERIREQVQNIE